MINHTFLPGILLLVGRNKSIMLFELGMICRRRQIDNLSSRFDFIVPAFASYKAWR